MSSARLGDFAGTVATLKAGEPLLATLRQNQPPGSWSVVAAEALASFADASAAYQRGELAECRSLLKGPLAQVRAVNTGGGESEFQRNITLAVMAHLAGRTDYLLGDYASAEQLEREAIKYRKEWGADTVADKRALADMTTWLALAQLRQGRTPEAATTIAPVVKLYRELTPRNHGDVWLPLELASALYTQALTDPKQRAALLQEAAGLVDGLAPVLRPLREVQQWRERIREAQRGAA
jgi:hypothetical protein